MPPGHINCGQALVVVSQSSWRLPVHGSRRRRNIEHLQGISHASHDRRDQAHVRRRRCHPIHKSRLVNDYVASLDGKLKLFYFPPYSPQLNPYEQVWAHVKRQVSQRLVQNSDDMKKLARGALRRIQKLPELVKAFFRQPECQYAA
jgi:transposase